MRLSFPLSVSHSSSTCASLVVLVVDAFDRPFGLILGAFQRWIGVGWGSLGGFVRRGLKRRNGAERAESARSATAVSESTHPPVPATGLESIPLASGLKLIGMAFAVLVPIVAVVTFVVSTLTDHSGRIERLEDLVEQDVKRNREMLIRMEVELDTVETQLGKLEENLGGAESTSSP